MQGQEAAMFVWQANRSGDRSESGWAEQDRQFGAPQKKKKVWPGFKRFTQPSVPTRTQLKPTF